MPCLNPTLRLPRIYRAVVEAGTAAGRLPAALESLAGSLRRLAETRRPGPILYLPRHTALLRLATLRLLGHAPFAGRRRHVPGTAAAGLGELIRRLACLGDSGQELGDRWYPW